MLKHTVLLFLLSSLAMAGCGGSSESTPTTITPSSVTLQRNAPAVFLVTASGTPANSFEWTVEGGTYTLSADHTSLSYIAGDVPGTYTITVHNTFTGEVVKAQVIIE